MRVKRIAKVIIFCVIFLFLLNRIYYILSWKDTAGEYYSSVNSYYDLEEDLVDVLFLGSSRCYCSINNAVLWDEYGIGNFSLSISGQDFAGTYHTLKEALKTQTPRVVCVELYGSIFDGYMDEGNLYRTTLPFKYSANFYNVVDNLVTDEEKKSDFWLKWPIVHTRYSELQKEDFLTDRPVYLGYHAEFRTQAIGPIEVYQGEEEEPLPAEREKWLQKIIELAKEKDIELCFFIAPYAVTEADQKIFKYVERIAGEHNIPVLNMLVLAEELELDVNTDFIDWAHTNYYGAQKVSEYVGEYLVTHYALEDHRGDERYALWDENSKVRRHEVYNHQMKLSMDIGTYLDLMSCIQEYVVVVSTAGEHVSQEPDISEYLQTLGIGEEFYASGGIWILEDGEPVYISTEANSMHYVDLGISDLSVSSVNGTKSIMVDKQNYQKVEQGINILVYDKILGEVVDWVGFSAPHAYGIAR